MVEIEAAGGKEAVDQLIAWCHQGPPSAQVERVEATWLKGQEKSQSSLNRTAEGFEIR
jgi:acylphosphatase